MDITRCYSCSSSSDNTVRTIRLGELQTPSRLRWKALWMKLKKEKKRFFECASSSSPELQASYDPYAYAKNFDQGCAWDDPDNLSRSFSVRFADPSRVSLHKGVV